MALLDAFYILFETDAKRVTQEVEEADAAAVKLSETLDKVASVDPSGVQNVATGMTDAADAAAIAARNFETAVEAVNKIDPSNTEAYAAAMAEAEKAAAELGVALGNVGKEDAPLLRDILEEVDQAALQAGESAATVRDNLQLTPPPARELTDELRNADRVAKGLGDTFLGFARQLAAPLALFFSARSVLGAIERSFATINNLTEDASRFNFNIEGYSAFNQIIEDMGGNAADAQRFVRRFADSIREAYGDAESDAGKALKSIGVSAADAQGDLKDTEAVLLDLADAVDGIDRRVAIDRLRRLGIIDPAMIKLVLEGRAELEKLIKTEKEKGLVTAEMARKVRDFKLAWDDAKDAVTTVFNQLAAGLAGPLKAFSDWLTKSVVWLRENNVAVGAFAAALVAGLTIVAAAVWGVYVPAWTAAAVAVIAATWPVLLIIAAVVAAAAAFALLWDDVQAFLKGQPSLIGAVLDKYEWLQKTILFLGDAFDTVKSIAGPVLSLIIDLVTLLGRTAATVAQFFWAVFSEVFQALWPLAQPIFELIMSGIRFVGDVFAAVANAIWGQWGAMFDRFVARVKLVTDLVRGLMGLVEGARGALESVTPGVARSAGQTAGAVARGQVQLAAARGNPLAAMSAGAVQNRATANVTKRGGDVRIDKVEVVTQATDADGMARAATGALSSQLRRTTAQFDDGVER